MMQGAAPQLSTLGMGSQELLQARVTMTLVCVSLLGVQEHPMEPPP